MRFLIRFCWFITLLSTAPAAFFLLVAVFGSSGAPQQAAGAALALGFVVIPYVFTRAFAEIAGKED